MSRENVEIVRAAHDAWNRRDFDSLKPSSAASCRPEPAEDFQRLG